MIKDRIIDNVLGIVAAKLTWSAVLTICELSVLPEVVAEAVVRVAKPRIEAIHNTYLKDPCYVEMTTEERTAVVKPYVNVITEAATSHINKLYHPRCVDAINQAFISIIQNRKS